MSCAARSRSLESHSSNCSPSAKRTTSRGWGTRGNSTSAKPKSVQEVSGGAGSDIFDMTRANTRFRRSWEGGRIKDAYVGSFRGSESPLEGREPGVRTAVSDRYRCPKKRNVWIDPIQGVLASRQHESAGDSFDQSPTGKPEDIPLDDGYTRVLETT